MKILLITDQHFGVRNDNQHFIEHYKKFYGEIVIPFIKAEFDPIATYEDHEYWDSASPGWRKDIKAENEYWEKKENK